MPQDYRQLAASLHHIPDNIRQTILDAQVRRFHRDYQKYFAIENTNPFVDFFLTKFTPWKTRRNGTG